jgi:hypothetical protein
MSSNTDEDREWQALADENGYTYYMNVITGESTWCNPCKLYACEFTCEEASGASFDSYQCTCDAEDYIHRIIAIIVRLNYVDDDCRETRVEENSGTWTLGGTDADGSFYFIHSTTGERVKDLPFTTDETKVPERSNDHTAIMSCADDSRRRSILGAIEPEIDACMQSILDQIDSNLYAWFRRKQRNRAAFKKKKLKTTNGGTTNIFMKKQQRVRVDDVLHQVRRLEKSDAYKEYRKRVQEELMEEKLASEVVAVTQRFILRHDHRVQKVMAQERARVRQRKIEIRHRMTYLLTAKATSGFDVDGKIDFTSESDMIERPSSKVDVLSKHDTSWRYHKENKRSEYASARTYADRQEWICLQDRAKENLEKLFVVLDKDQRGLVTPLYLLYMLTTRPYAYARIVDLLIYLSIYISIRILLRCVETHTLQRAKDCSSWFHPRQCRLFFSNHLTGSIWTCLSTLSMSRKTLRFTSNGFKQRLKKRDLG